jgi:hypothetical protein
MDMPEAACAECTLKEGLGKLVGAQGVYAWLRREKGLGRVVAVVVESFGGRVRDRGWR